MIYSYRITPSYRSGIALLLSSLLVFVAVLLGCDSENESPKGTTESPAKKVDLAYHLLFTSNRDGDSGIYSVRVDGTGFRTLASSPDASHPAWSPDGKSILFTTEGDLWVMDYRGQNKKQLTNTPDDYEDVGIWSPDGTAVAFLSEANEGGTVGLCMMDADGSNRKTLTNKLADMPAWSPDGSQIAFIAVGGGISVIDINGTNLVNLTDIPYNDYGPTWSPDGSQIAFHTTRDGNGEIYLMNADGSELTNLTNSTADESVFGAQWSPDGQWLVYDAVEGSAEEGLVQQIFVIRSDGTSKSNLTADLDPAYDPRWSPDGARIAFSAYSNGNDEVYVMDADGSNRKNVSQHASDDLGPQWSPVTLR